MYRITPAVFLSSVISLFSFGHVEAQGPLVPPGAPAPLFKTLEQVEPRTPISYVPTNITVRGSYYLTTNLTGEASSDGITISSDDVTLDLNGFTLQGVGDSLAGILVAGDIRNLTVRNGIIRQWDGGGIIASTASESRFENLNLYDNDNAGLYAGTNCAVQSCLSASNPNAKGIWAEAGSRIQDCTAVKNGMEGILAGSGCAVERNKSTENSGDGIKVTDRCHISGNTCELNVMAGIHVTGPDNRIEDNQVISNAVGLFVDATTGNIVLNNTVKRNVDNYSLTQGNQLNILLCEIPETIEWPANVLLAGTLIDQSNGQVNGIRVKADDVTIDLGGHTLIGSGEGIGSGIYQDANRRNLAVLNGKITNWRGVGQAGLQSFGTGNQIAGLQATTNHIGLRTGPGSTITDCTASGNDDNGINTASGSTISKCAVSRNGGNGIFSIHCTIIDSAAYANTETGIVATQGSVIRGCNAFYNVGSGIIATAATTINNCSATSNSDGGIAAYQGGTISGCSATYNGGGDGILVVGDGFVVNCIVEGNSYTGGSGAGIHVTSSGSRIDGNQIVFNGIGIKVDAAGNFIVRNSAKGNGTNYVITANNNVGVIVAAPVSLAISGSTGGAGVGSTDPWANFSY